MAGQEMAAGEQHEQGEVETAESRRLLPTNKPGEATTTDAITKRNSENRRCNP